MSRPDFLLSPAAAGSASLLPLKIPPFVSPLRTMNPSALPKSGVVAVLRRAVRFQVAVTAMLLPGLTIWTSPVMANPRGGSVIHGNVNIGAGTGGNLQIRQNSQNAIIDWESFSIDKGELTQFRQPNSNAAVLNRVTGGDPTAIHGALRANGNVFVINPNGILVGPGGTIDVHGLVLSTLDVSNGEFLAGGDMTFAGVGEGVTNLGRINAIGGDVFLIGRTVTNSGSISATGTVGLAAGEEVLLTAGEGSGGERMFVRAKGSGVSGTGIFNDGTIEGAAVELKAHGNIYALAINNKGSIRATGATSSGGRVYLRGAGGTVENTGSIRATSSGSGDGGRILIEAAYAKVDGMIRAQGGQVRISGTDRVDMNADLDATNSGGRGGDVVVEGGEIVLGNGGKIDASGATGGGNVRVGGGFQGRDTTVRNARNLTVAEGAVVRSDALVSGPGGNVILWADNDTLFNGEVSARGFSRGGFAEISGKQNLGFDGLVDLTAVNGPSGSLLLDPTNVTIGTAAASATNINNIALSNTLDQGTNVIIATNFGSVVGARGDITVLPGTATAIGQNAGGIEWYQQSAGTVGGTLSLLATGNILFANDVRSAGAGGINIVAGWDGVTGIVDPLSGAAETTPGAFNMAAVLATLNDGNPANDAAGLNAGSVFINGYDINGTVSNTVTEGIEVGSRFGATRVAAHDLLMRGSTGGNARWAQLGFRDSGNEFGLNGTIAIATQGGERNEWWGSNGAANGSGGATQWGNIQNKDYIALLGGTVESGPGGLGAFKGAGYGATGAIEIGLSGRLDARGGDNDHSYVQIGHGGTGAEGIEIARNAQGIGQVSVTTRDGAVIDVADNNRTYFGTSWRTNYQGVSARVNANITIKTGEDILIMAPNTFETNTGFTDLSNNQGSSSRYALVGHGGLDNFGSYHGNISVIALGATTALDGRGLAGSGIQLRAGMGSLNIAQIGHGGFHEGNRRTIFDQTSSGNISVRAETGAVRALGYNLMPRTGDQATGPYVGVNTILPAGSNNDIEYEFSNVQIGHGGWHRDRVTTGGVFTAPAGFTATAVLPDQSMSGNIDVYAGGTVQVRDNMGYDQFGNWTPDPGPGVDPLLTSGGILREVGIEVRAGNNGNAYGQIGHGGFNMNSNTTGTIQGNIGVTAAKGSILFVGGEEKRSQRDWGFGGNYVQIGHGGFEVDAMNATSGFGGSISVLAGQGGTNGLGQTITPTGGDIIFRTGRAGESWAQIGHGGRSSNGDLIFAGNASGIAPITVTARDAVEFTGRLSNPTLASALVQDYIDINITDSNFDDANDYANENGNLIDQDTIPQSNSRGLGYNIDIKHAQIGHGGYDFLVDNQPAKNFSLNNPLAVTAQTGALRFTASNADNDYIMIGTGGMDFANQRNISGANITISAGREIVMDASTPGVMEYNRIPIAGANGFETRQFARGVRGFAMIGNGGHDVDGDFSGSITVTSGAHLHMLSSNAGPINTVTNYVGTTVTGPIESTGTRTTLSGNAHAYTALQEATMKARSFFLYHGNGGAAPGTNEAPGATVYYGSIVPGTFRIDTDDTDLGDYLGDGLLRRGAAGTQVFGTIDYASGRVTIYERHLGDDNAINRNMSYSYNYNGTVQAIVNERTPESDSAIRASQAYLGHGGIIPGTVSVVIDGDNNGGGRRVISDTFGNGVLYNENHVRVGQIDYPTGRVIFEGVNTATGDGPDADTNIWDLGTSLELRAPLNSRTNPDEVVANYQYAEGNRDVSFVHLGNGGYSTSIGGRNSAGHSGKIMVTAAGDIRLHGGAFDDSSVQIGHGGRGAQSFHGVQTDQAANRVNPDLTFGGDESGNIVISSGGILELLAGRGLSYWDNEQYAQVGHGGYDADGHHQGNISITAGSGIISTRPGVIGGSGQTGGIVFTAGQSRDASAQLGHGGFGARSAREDGDSGVRGLTGNITVNAAGSVLFTSGTSLFNYQDNDDGRLSSQLGHGGYDADVRHDGGTQLRGTGIGHFGNISVISSNGSIVFQAGDESKAAPGGFSLGNGNGILHATQLGHGGAFASGDHHGNITVQAAQDIQFYGGSRTQDDSTDKRNYALLGHGGDDAEGYMGARNANNDPLDEIRVTATNGDIEFVAGEGRRNWVQLGNGGYSAGGDSVANLFVTAGGDINFIGGQGSQDNISDASRSLDIASWMAGTNQGGWTQLRYRDVRVNVVDFTITVAGFEYVARGSTVQEGDADGAFTGANLVAKTNVDLNGDTVVDITAGQVVGEINLRTGQVRFFRDLDPNATGLVTASYNNAGGSSGAVTVTTAVENSTTNPMLAQAVRGVGNFSSVSPSLQATFNNTRGGITDVSEGGGTTFGDNIGIRSGTFRINVPDGTVVQDDGAGNLVVSAAGAGSGLAVGANVGSINYLRGQIVLEDAINSKGLVGVRAYYQVDRPIGSDLSYAQLGNGGYEASDITTNNDKSSVGNITMNAGANVRFHGGNGVNAYTQLGNGGYNNKGAHSGNITVGAGGAIEFMAGWGADETDQRAYAQLGHGGYDSDGNHFGNISITGGVGFASSKPGYANLGDSGTQIGVLFKGGDRADSYTQLGHGGRSARSGTATTAFGLNGNIGVTSGGSVSFVAGTGKLDPEGDVYASEDFRLYAQLGHGGHDADAADSNETILFFGQLGGTGIAGTEGGGDGHWGHFGDITVNAGGSINLLGGDHTRTDPVLRSAGGGAGSVSHVQAGHGGYHSSGNHHGDIVLRAGVTVGGGGPTVTNPNADIVLEATNQHRSEWADTRSYAQIGHGGLNASADALGRAGDVISVMAGRDVLVRGGTGVGNYAQIGHGGTFLDRVATDLTRPVGVNVSRGDIDVFAGRDLKVSGAMLSSALENSYVYTGSDDLRSLDRAANLAGGGDFTLQYNRVIYGSIVMEIRRDDGSLVGRLTQSGNNIVTETAFTQDMNGNGTIEPTEVFTAGQVVGTYNPLTNAITFNRDVNPGADDGAANLNVAFQHLNIDRGYAQIGHGGYDADYTPNGITSIQLATARRAYGDITIGAGGDVALKGGDGFANYSQIGHGGYATAGVREGDIKIGSLAQRIGGAVLLEGGTGPLYEGNNAHAMIGHGGRSSTGTSFGDIEIFATNARDVTYGDTGVLVRAGNRVDNFALVGHGGTSSRSGTNNGAAGMEGNTGNITVDAIGDVNVIAGVLNRGGSTVGQSVDDGNLYAQIGHGGYDVDVSLDGTTANGNGIGHNGDIRVISREGSVNVLGGDHLRSLLPSTAPTTGAFESILNSGFTRMDAIAGGRFHYALIGHGGYESRGNHYGDITVHAGYDSDAIQTGTSADSSVRVVGGRFLADQDDSQQFAQIGHGGRTGVGDQGRAGEIISVMAAGNVEVHAGDGVDTYAQIGNGGTNARGDHNQAIQILAGGAVSVLASDLSRTSTLGNGLFTRYYHVSTANAGELNQNLDRGGLLQSVAGGNAAGVVNFRAVNGVIADSVKLEIFNDSGVRIGTIEDDGSGALKVVSDFTELVGGSQLVAGQQVGTVNYAANTLTFTTRVNPGAEGGAANVIVNLEHVRTERAYAQIGHGGYDSDNPDGNVALGSTGDIRISALSGDVTARGGTSTESYSQIGHGGRSTNGANSGNIFVRAAGNFGLYGGNNNRTFAQVGHGGYDSDGNHTGDVLVSAGSGNLFTSLSHTKGAAGGWFNDMGDFNRNAVADELLFSPLSGKVSLIGGTGGTHTSASIGHGGHASNGDFSGDIGVSSFGDIELLAGTGSVANTQIGHGGHNQDTAMNLAGAVHVISETGNLVVRAGTGFESYSLIGHGDDQDNNTANSRGTRQGRIHVIANNITLDRNSNRVAWIGHSFDMATDQQDPFADQALQTPADNLGGGYEVIGRNGLTYTNAGAIQNSGAITVTDSFRDRMITPNLKDANFAMSGGNIIINSVIDGTTSYSNPASVGNSVTFLAAGDIDVNRRISSPGSGSVNLVAGANLARASIMDAPSRTGGVSGTNLNFPDIDHLWNVPTGYVDFSKVRIDGLQWGNDNGFSISSGEFASASGEISIDGANNGGTFNLGVGSKAGDTIALGQRVRLIGGDAADEYAMLGFFTDAAGDPATGNIWVGAKAGGVLVQSGSGARSSAQIGHGGNGGNTNLKNLSGSISVRADGGGAIGNISVLSGTGDTGQAQIGHGGRQNDGSHSGDIVVIGEAIAVTSAASVAQIGHGGFQGTGAYSGNLFINHDPLANGGLGAAVGGGGALSITAGSGFDDYAQIGHGGVVATTGNRTGNIIVGRSASVTLQGGTNKSTSAQLGHGGVGAGTGTLTGNIEVNTAGNVSVLAGASATGQGSAFAQIGHGGTSASGTKSGNITINSLGTMINVAGPSTSVVSNTNYAQIGHGGDNSGGGTLSGNLVIDAPNAGLSLTAGNQARAFAKVGHGGYSSSGAQSGTLGLTLGGAVNLTGGGDHSFAQIGHGGSLGTGNRDGAISVISTSGNLSMTSGAGLNASTQIGHGGVGATGNHGSSLVNGGIKVGIAGNILLNAGAGTDAYAQIGQGGSGAIGTHLGDICVTANGTITFNNGLHGAGARAYGQIGHGGYNAAGNHGGSITAVSGYVNNGGISMNGGAGTDQYVQIGHGGTNASGNLSGRVYVVADKDGDLVMNGGSAAGTYAMISHGDGHGTYGSFGSGTTSGTRQGGIQYFVDGDAILNAGTGANSNVHLIHRTNSNGGLNGTNYLGGDGYQYVVNGTSIGNAASDARENEGTIIAGNFGTGNIVVTNTGNLTLNLPNIPTGEFVNHSFSFIVLSTGNLNFERSFQNAGTGLVALVAGWDGVQDLSTINYNNGPCDPEIIPGSIDFNDCDRFGNNGGILTVGSATQAGPFAVGSRQGQTILRGYGINVVGSNTTAGGSTQIGFRADGTGDITGTIDVRAKQGGLTLQAGSADNAFVQIGHGTGSGTFSNNVTNAATVNISFCEPGVVTLNGAGNGAFAMIGNGGGTGNYARGGNTTLSNVGGVALNGGTGSGAFTQIGNGGVGGQGAVTGNVSITGTGNVSLVGGAGGNAFAHLGAGGLNHIGAITSTTSVITTGGNLTMTGGAGAGAFAQLGAGGLNADGVISGGVTATVDGAIQLTGGSQGDTYVQIGAGGSGSDGVKSGNVTVSGASATLTGGSGAGASVLVGNGGGIAQGTTDNASGSISGNTSLTTTAGAVTMNASAAAADNFVQIGAGGRSSVGSANTINSTTTVNTTGGGLTMNAANAAYAQIGAGGHQVDALSVTGNVLVNAGGTIAISGGSGQNRYAQIGNGGMGADGAKNGDTTVTGTSLLMTTGSGAGSNVLIGLGGGMDQTTSDFSNGAITGNVLVTTTTDGVTMNAAPAGTQAFAQIGNGGLVSDGAISGTTTVNSAGAVALTAGAQSNAYARIGAGGSGNDGTISNAATTVTGTNLVMTAGSNTSAYTQIGAGGGATGGGNLALGNITGDVSVMMSGTIAMNGGSGGSAFSQIGAGGAGINGSAATNTITSTTNVSGTSFTMNSGSGSGAYVQIGAGGGTTGVGAATPALGSINGNVTVNATAGGISMGATSSGTRSYVQIGAGGSGIDGGAAALGSANTITSNTSVTTVGGDLTMNSSLASSTQIGAGGLNADGTINGSVTVNVGGNLNMTGGVGTRRSAQIGNGGQQSDGAKSGAINVTANAISLAAGSTERAFAQIGHGGADASGVVSSANITVNSIGAISLASGGNQAYTQIGHGGFNALNLTVPNSSITINNTAGTGTGDITLSGGSGTNASATIGHGGARTDGNANVGDVSATGDVSIQRAANVRVIGGSNTDAFAQIGHAGERAIATFGGNVSVNSSGLVQVSGGTGGTGGTYGQIGHGGRLHNGAKSGTITVTAVGPLSLLGGSVAGAAAQIGHGGNAAAGNSTGDIALSVGGAIALTAGSQNETYAQVGHGGHLATGTFGGNVGLNYSFLTNQVTGAAGALTMTGGTGAANDAYAQFGHGGSSNNTGTHVKSGNVVVGGVSSATLSGGTSTGGDNYVQIGHGGDENDGAATGSVALLSSGLVTLNGANSGSDGYVQIGLGGHESTGNFGAAGDLVSVVGVGIDLNGGSGLRSSVQIGSGGYNADGNLEGNVFVNVNPLNGDPAGGGAITVNGGSGAESFAQIGIGGAAQDGSKNGNTTIRGASLEVVAGAGAAANAQIGAGSGIRSDLSDFGSGLINTTTSVTATTGGVILSAAGAGAHAFAQIGGGGLIADGALSGNTGLSTVVNAAGDIVITGGSNSNNYAMIGLGGSGGDGVKVNAGTSVTGTSVTMNGGSGASAFTQIGSGGGLTGGNNISTGAVTGDTLVTTTTGGITATSGSGANAYSMIGTGGSNLPGDISATVSVNSAGVVTLNSASGGAGAFTQIGAGGLNADGVHTGTTTVTAAGAVSLTGGANSDTYSQIGSGGAGSDGNKVNATVSVRGASVAMTSGAGLGAYTQIGSGGGATGAGALPTGTVTGPVNVVTTTGGISLAGGGDRAYSQIGQGGGGRNGDFSGEIQIVSADGLSLTGGTTARGYALVGNGGIADAGGFTTGLREGNVLVRVDGLTQLADGASTAFIGHRGAAGVTGASRLALVTGQIDTTGNATLLNTMIANMVGAGGVEIGVTNGDLLLSGPALNYNSASALDLFASGNITVMNSLQNAGAGSLNLVAGWDGTTGLAETINPAIFPPISALALDYSAVAADTAAYTNNGGVVAIGDGTQTTPIAVGAALGETNLLGDGVALRSGNAAGAYAQLGFRGTSNALINGTINVGVGASGLVLESSAQSGAFTQIGHGGSGATSAPVQADINLDFANAGSLMVSAGDNNAAYAQIGHGGASYTGTVTGDITATGTIGVLAVIGGGAASQAAYAQIGHGGDSAFGNKTGDITLEAEEVSVEAGAGFRSGAQIGHGGRAGVGTLTGSIDVTTTVGDLSVAAGAGNLSAAQIGHGGQGYNGIVADQPITLDVAGNLTVQGGSANQAFAIIGHGGAGSSGGTLGGDVVVNVGESLEINGGTGLNGFAQIGHGGGLVTGDMSGDITVAVGGDANLAAPASATSGAYAKIGHGDDMRGGFGAAGGSGARTGNIEVAADGSIVMNQALIGHTNSTSNATSAGTTQLAVSAANPANPAGGNLVANATSEFSGDEIRFYLPRRANNQVAAGAMMNGVAYTGGLSDPNPSKGADEYANFIQTTSGTTQLGEHDSTFGSGPAPATAGAYAFYFDTIVQGTPPTPPLPPEPPVPPVPPAPDYRDTILDDRVIDDWLRDQEVVFSAPGTTSIFYEGYEQYGPNGESIYNFNNAAGMGSDEEEDVLRRQLQILEEQAGQENGTENNAQGAE